MLKFNFCIMAEIANLARYLLMSEVLQICEFVHKQVEEKKLKVYQKGDVHTVVSKQLALQEDLQGKPGAYMLTIQGDGGAVVTQSGVAVTGEPLAFVAAPEEAYIQQSMTIAAPVVSEAVEGGEEHHVGQNETVTLVTHSGEAEPGETVTLISGRAEGMEGETMTVVTHSGQAGASESLAMVSACLAMEQPQESESVTFVINMDPDKVTPPEVVTTAPVAADETVTPPHEKAEAAPAPQKRKRGRPAKVKKEVEVKEYVPLEEEDPSTDESHGDQQEAASDDLNKRRLRQRSIAEGGYARLHMGLEDDEEGKKNSTPPRVATPKVRHYVLPHIL